MNPLNSRKAAIGTVASLIATGLAFLSVYMGWVPAEKKMELIESLTQVVMALWGVIVLAIGIEDAGAKSATTATAISAPEAKTVTVNNDPQKPPAVVQPKS